MKSFIEEKGGRIVVIHLKRGELLVENVESELERLNIKNAVLLSCIGSLRKAVFHYITTNDDLPIDEIKTLEQPIEVASTQGIVLDGKVHFHFAISDLDNCYIGHVENGCIVQNLIEISLMEMPSLKLTRKLDEYGISYITNND